jgi:hypothetical protein
MIGGDNTFGQDKPEPDQQEEISPSPSPLKIIKLNGREPSKEKKVISFNVVNDN